MPYTANWYGVDYGDDKFVAIAYGSDYAAVSDDGLTWAAAKLPSSTQWCALVYGYDKFVSVSYNKDGKVAYSGAWGAEGLPRKEC